MMGNQTAKRIAWSIVALALLLKVGSFLLEARLAGVTLLDILWALNALVFIVTGAIIVSHHASNPVGWLLLVIAAEPLGLFALQYAEYSAKRPGFPPGGTVLAWLASWLAPPVPLLTLPLMFLLFPDGRLPSRRWRALVCSISGWVLLIIVASAFTLKPLPLEDSPLINPLAAPAPLGQALMIVQALGWALFPLIGLVAAASLMMRFRRARGGERQQLKLLLYAAALIVLATLLAVLLTILVGTGWLALPSETILLVGNLALLASLFALAAAFGIAILRYRLYDIDIIINKTLVYGLLTGTLALVYFGSVVTIQQLFRALTGQESQFAVVVSTLAIAALFNPLRQRIQGFIDRRFYRKKYDAQKTLLAFSESTRSASSADLEHLTGELVRVIEETMHPAYLSVWLRDPQATPEVK